jgi:hypothetical protein
LRYSSDLAVARKRYAEIIDANHWIYGWALFALMMRVLIFYGEGKKRSRYNIAAQKVGK